MIDGVTVSKLEPDDVARLKSLNGVFARAFEDAESYASKAPGDAYLAETLSRPHVIVFVAEIAGAVVGGLTAYQLDKLEQDRREIYIYDLAVDESVRRRGIATALIRALQDEADRRRAYVIFVQADPGDDPALALYGSLGEREAVFHFDILPRRRC